MKIGDRFAGALFVAALLYFGIISGTRMLAKAVSSDEPRVQNVSAVQHVSTMERSASSPWQTKTSGDETWRMLGPARVGSDNAHTESMAREVSGKRPAGQLDGALDCTAAIPLGCGEGTMGDNADFPANANFYACTSRDESGPEVVYTLELLENMYVAVNLSANDCDLDVFLLNSCEENDCAYFGNSDFTTDCLPAGIYYVVVDGHYGAACPYELSVDCVPCGGPGGPGNTCTDAIVVHLPDDLPFTDAAQTTCGRGDDYNATCLGDYDGGQDIIYAVTVSSPTDVDISLDPHGTSFTGICLDSMCPPGNSCMAFSTNDGADAYGLYGQHLEPGTYYLMIDTWPPPPCIISFDLSIVAACTVECPLTAFPEGEPTCYDNYDDQYNGGCGSVPPVFTDLSCGETVCGTSGTFLMDGLDYRDTDWYQLVLSQSSTLTFSVTAEFPVLAILMDAGSGNCSDYTMLISQTAPPCSTATLISDCVHPGLYWLWIAPSVFSGVPCGAKYVATASCEPCYGGTIEVSADYLDFPATYIDETSSVDVVVSNVSLTGSLAVTDIITNGHIWSADPTNFVLPPGGTQPVTLTFSPTFEYNFEGTIEFLSSDETNPRDSVTVVGLGCVPVSAPPPPRLLDAASPTDIYFAMPWDANNGHATQYAVEISSNGFATSAYATLYSGPSEMPEYWTAAMWGQWGTGLLEGLEPNTDYQVRLHARDRKGVEAIGLPATMTTRPQVALANPQLTIQVIYPDTIELRWDPVARDTSGQELNILGWSVLAGETPEVMTEIIELSLTGTAHIPISVDTTIRFFEVDPIGVEGTGIPAPFISWPPEGATVTGMNSIYIDDILHKDKWDSFRVEMDVSGEPTLLGSSWDNPWSESDLRAVTADFDQFTPGLHTITATVKDSLGMEWATSIDINIVPDPTATFGAQYDSLNHEFTVMLEDPQNIGSGYTDVLWQTSAVGERYGDMIRFEWNPTTDSLTVVEPQLKLIDKQITESGLSFSSPAMPGGVLPDPSQPLCDVENIQCCCDTLMLRTTGYSRGSYGWRQDSVELGPKVNCRGGRYEVAFKFEVELHLRFVQADVAQDCYWGQDCRRTDTTNMGNCNAGVFTPVTRPARLREWYGHKEYGGTRYPADTTTYGNDDYRPDRHGANHDESKKAQGIVRWFDWPQYGGELPQNSSGYTWAIRARRNAKFFARSDTECAPGNQDCCIKWELGWDVVFCADCSIVQNTAPHIFNVTTSGTCDALKPN